MTEAARIYEQVLNPISHGLVEKIGDTGLYQILADGVSLSAQQAASCSLCPEVGDEVTLIHLSDGRAFIIAVLLRASNSPQTHSFPEGLTVDLGSQAQFVSSGELGFTSETFTTSANEIGINAKHMKLVGGIMDLVARSWQFFGRTIFASVEQVNQQLGQSSRLVRGHDETVSGSIMTQAKNTHITQAKEIVTTAGESVRIDGKQINLA